MFAAIAGRETAAEPPDLDRMAAALRGASVQPRTWRSEHGEAGFASAPTGILPEDIFDRQPIVGDDFTFVCQARLDNRADLIGRLGLEPARAAEMADSDILALCYRRWRDETPQQVYGDYAFAAWEPASGRLVAATDHIGNVPLFYCVAKGRLLLATQLPALMAHPSADRTLNQFRLGMAVLARYEVGETLFKAVRHLPGGSIMTFRAGELAIRTWWRPNTAPSTWFRKEQDYVDLARERLSEAVSRQLRAVGEIATTISGGLDSTIVSALAARRLAESGRGLTAYTSVPAPGVAVEERPGWDADDGPWAAAVADMHPNMRHVLVAPDGKIPTYFSPQAHRSSLSTARNVGNQVWGWQISEAARAQGARVILSGGRGNATLSAVGAYGPRDLTRLGGQIIFARSFLARGRDYARWGVAALRRPGEGYSYGQRPKSEVPRRGHELLSAGFRAQQAAALHLPIRSPADRASFTRFMAKPGKLAGPDALALHGVEWRDPTADRRYMETVLTFPQDVFRAGRRDRGLAREVGVGLLPDIVRLRTNRGAQAADYGAWFALRADDYRRVLSDMERSPLCRELFDLKAVDQGLSDLRDGSGTSETAFTVGRALDVGQFITAYENGDLWTPIDA